MHTATSEHVEQGNAPDNFHRFAPSFSVSLQPWQEETLFLRLMYKSTFRLPTFNDLYYYRLGNRDLRPEKANEYNLGITWSKSGLLFLNYLSMTVDGYYNDVTDKIVAFPTTYAWKMANYGKVHASGIDMTLSAGISLAKNVQLLLSGGYMWQKAIDLTSSDAKRYYLSQNIPENEIEGYLEHTMTASREFALGNCSLHLQAEIINLTDAQYDVIKYYPMPGRSWRLTAVFKF